MEQSKQYRGQPQRQPDAALPANFRGRRRLNHPAKQHLLADSCQGLATELGGSISFTSALGEGSTFSLRLPMVRKSELP
jgi:hypothetical protein